jgi:hypothetical protein
MFFAERRHVALASMKSLLSPQERSMELESMLC